MVSLPHHRLTHQVVKVVLREIVSVANIKSILSLSTSVRHTACKLSSCSHDKILVQKILFLFVSHVFLLLCTIVEVYIDC
jgi:hypothetical protein